MSHAENLRLTAAARVARGLELVTPEEYQGVILLAMTLVAKPTRCPGCGHDAHGKECRTIFNGRACGCAGLR